MKAGLEYNLSLVYSKEYQESKEFLKMEDKMEIATVSDKGQITIPISVRRSLKLKGGDKVVIQEENGRYYFDNAALVAFTRVAESFEGAAKEAGFNSEEEMQEYMKDIRKEVRGY